MSHSQRYQPTWNVHEDPADQATQFQRAREAIAGVDWAALPDFQAIMTAGKRQHLMGMGTPARYGGLGLTTRQLCTLFRQFERADTASSHSVGYFNSLGVLPLLFAGALDLGGYVERIARGAALGSFALTEPQGGSHMAGMREMARKAGHEWVLNGMKLYIAHAQDANFFLVCARTGEGFKVFALDANAPGVHVVRTFQMAYMRRILVNEILFDAVRVPEDHVIHDAKVIYDSMMLTRVYILAGKIGHIERCLDHLRPFVQSRMISTGPMSENPTVRRRMRRLELSVAILESVLEYALREEEAQGASYEIAMVGKIVGVILAQEASYTLQSLYGARGLDPGSGIPIIADDVRVWSVMEGCNEPMQHFLAANYLARKPWIAQFVAAHPNCFAALPADLNALAHDADIAAFGEALAWAIARGCIEALGVATPETNWLLERRCAACMDEVLGPRGAALPETA